MRNIFAVAAIVLGAALITMFRAVLLVISSALYVYLLPGVVAQRRQHLRQREIYIVTALTGWLVLPWVLALLYAAKGEHNDAVSEDISLATSLPND
jgi:cell shape-determining protein MreD